MLIIAKVVATKLTLARQALELELKDIAARFAWAIGVAVDLVDAIVNIYLAARASLVGMATNHSHLNTITAVVVECAVATVECLVLVLPDAVAMVAAATSVNEDITVVLIIEVCAGGDNTSSDGFPFLCDDVVNA